MKYRADIDGLRSIAVLAVLIFHINPSYLPGGFVGVDVFFVISGFLITNIVKHQIENKKFNYKDFYTKRIKRLLPLFFAVVTFSFIAGYFLLFPDVFRQFSGDALAATLFLSNVKSAFSGNYFDHDNIRPLLHFWSLAVEEQFYFIMPTFLIIIMKYFRKYVLHLLVVTLLISLASAEYFSSDPKYAQLSYFLLPTRAWELLAGGIFAFTTINLSRNTSILLSWIGVALIGLSLFVINEQSVFPGIITLLPVVGSVFLILSNGKGFGEVLSKPLFVSIGTASYSIYMWHWPIIIFTKLYFGIKEFTAIEFVLVFAITIGVGYLSKKYIEDYFRFKERVDFKRAMAFYLILPVLITIGLSGFVYKSGGMPSRYGIEKKFTVTSTVSCPPLNPGCLVTKNKDLTKRVMLLGDSHAEHFGNLFTRWFDDNNLSLELMAASGCNFYSNDFYSNPCEDLKLKIKKELEEVNTVIIAKRLDFAYEDAKFKKEFFDFVSKLASSGKTIILIKQVPKFKESGFLEKWMTAKRFGKEYVDDCKDVDISYDKANKVVLGMFEEMENISILDFNSVLKKSDDYIRFDDNNLPIYFNADHLTAYGSEWIYEKIKNMQEYKWLLSVVKKNIVK